MTDGRYRVLIIDDEYYFRKLLIRLIDWESLGFFIAGEAENGEQALQLVREHPYDLYIVDIDMPVMNGLAFAETLRETGGSSKFIFITSYDLFQYAQAAVSLGASHYLLKPVDEDELARIVKEIRDELDLERQKSRDMEALQQQVREMMPVLKERFVRQLLVRESAEPPSRLEEQALFYGIPRLDTGWAVILLSMDEAGGKWKPESERQLRRFAVENVCMETFGPPGGYCVIVDDADGRMVILSSASEGKEADLRERCERARVFLRDSLGIRSTWAYGNIYEDLFQVHLSYTEAVYALKRKFAVGGDRVIAYGEEETDEEGPGAVYSITFERSEWLNAIRLRDKRSVAGKIDDLCDRLIAGRIRKETSSLALMECVSIGITALLERGRELPASVAGADLFHRLYALETIEDIRVALREFLCDTVIGALNRPETGRPNSDIVRAAAEIIRTRYPDEKLSLQQTARELFVNPSYLSHVFKKEMGKSFVEYLTDVRLEKALELMGGESWDQAHSFKLAHIASRVGYSDPYYFSKCFKKKFGIVPSKYRT
jgi:two-component system response regulator YesN